tara:strand:+ start:71 stop:508 length:438 start_codon:yes stop_codon:yes gene_type:complete
MGWRRETVTIPTSLFMKLKTLKLKKIFYTLSYIFTLTILSNCVTTSASLIGPVITAAKTGNVYQAGLSYASNNIIKNQLGSTPSEYVINLINQDSDEDTQNPSEDGLILSINKSNKLKKIELSLNSKKNEPNYGDFLKAVEKVLK